MKKGWLATAFLVIAQALGGQQTSTADQLVKPGMTVKTVPLHHLSSAEAVKLLSPYIKSANGGVFEVSPSIRAVTIREFPATFSEMMAVLNTYDREPASVTLNFQLISAENTATRDASLAGLDSLLRGVLRYTGYRLIGTSVAAASEHGRISQTLAGEDGIYSLSVDVDDVRVDGSAASVRIGVMLWQRSNKVLLQTSVTVPIGQTVVLGTTSAAPAAHDSLGVGRASSNQQALILTVRPQLANTKR
jgi:hypothetical protein